MEKVKFKSLKISHVFVYVWRREHGFVDELIHDIVSAGITTKSGHFMMASPMQTPAMRIVISNIPSFITNDKIMAVLSRYGTMVSRISMIPPGCRNENVKHVMSFRSQVYILFRISVRPACDRPRNSNRDRVAHRSDNSVVTLLEQRQELVTGGGLTSPQSCQLATRAG